MATAGSVRKGGGISSVSDREFSLGQNDIPAHDYAAYTYTGSNVTTITYKIGGSGGTTVAVETITYDGSNNVTSKTRTS